MRETKMNIFRWMSLSACVALLAACSTPRAPAPIEDRATGARPTSAYEGKPGYYVVKQGDTVMQVSRMTGQKPADLIAWNNLSKPNELTVGQVLRIAPHGSEGETTVTSGGTASRSLEITPLYVGAASPASGTTSGTTSGTQTGTAPAGAMSAGVMNKMAPRGDKQPYSDATLLEMQQNPDYTGAANLSGKSASTMEAQKTVAPASGTRVNGASAGWRWPADGRMVSVFSDNKSKGIDIAGMMGQPVMAAADGKVTHVGPLRGYGNMVIVKHDDNLNSVYAHNKRILVKEGDAVAQGQQIAEMGNSDSDTVKLRFEIRQHGKPVDPSRYLPPR